ncbi:MAG: hypothetical protein QM778_16115 [Myxococcales bacterium]
MARHLRLLAVLFGCLGTLGACDRAPATEPDQGAEREEDDDSEDFDQLPTTSNVDVLGTDLAVDLAPNACQTGLASAGSNALCASCACGRCESEAEGCAGDTACSAAVACMHASGCSGMQCYCGTSPFGCLFGATGACKAEFEKAAGKTGESNVSSALTNASSALGRAAALQTCTRGQKKCNVACSPDSEACSFHDDSCIQRYCDADPVLEAKRAESARSEATPLITQVSVNGKAAWTTGSSAAPVLKTGDRVTLDGQGFGAGTDVDFSKLLLGHTRILESDLFMYEQVLNISTQVHHETSKTHSTWPKDILSWSDTRIEFRVPSHASRGPIMVQVQKRTGANGSLLRPGELHAVLDTQQLRVEDPAFKYRCDVVSTLSAARVSNRIPVSVDNSGLVGLVKKGREIFWSYDYNIGLAHALRGLDWTAMFAGKTKDPITGQTADPRLLFGAYPTVAGEVPDEAIKDVYFDPYPMKSPIPGFLTLGAQNAKGNTSSSGYVGYRYAEMVNPYTGPGKWIGFNCASCHSYRISYENAPGQQITRVIPGLPNPRWSMKWSLLGNFKGVVADEPGPLWAQGTQRIDKTTIAYAMPPGTGEHNLIRINGEGSHTDNDYDFSPIAIPNVTYYLPIRRSLGHTESYVGFEGSYIHSEEPDGAMGSMDAASLKALTAYMGQLDANDDDLRSVGLYRWLKYKKLSALHGVKSEGEFVQKGARSFPALATRLDQGKQTFVERCASCHGDGTGSFSNERMIPLSQVGRFFEPTIYQKEVQSIRATFLRDLYFTQHRGLLSDGHVRNIEELVHPDRCREGSDLYKRYYTIHPPTAFMPAAGPDFPATLPNENARGDVFRVIRSDVSSDVGKQRNAHVERYRYFSKVPWDPTAYYWDFQKMRKEYGPWEIGSAEPIGMPAAPHPWCAANAGEMDDLVLYLMSL